MAKDVLIVDYVVVMIKISVIIPVFDVQKYLRQCLDSIVGQTLQEIEIICVDDGSTDDSLLILKEYEAQDSRVRILRQENRGAGAARNHGLKYAKGEYLSFLDADDFFAPDMLEKAYAQCMRDKADLLIYKIQIFTNDTGEYSDAPKGFRKEYIPEKIPFTYRDMPDYIFNSFQNWIWNKLFKRSLIEKNKLKFQELKRTNDLLFTCMALVTAEKITLLDEVLAYYRVGTQTNSQATNHQYPLDFYKAFLALKQALNEMKIFAEVERSFVNWALNGCIYNLKSLKNDEAYASLYNVLRNEAFEKLGIDNHPVEYYYKPQDYDAFRKIKHTPFPTYMKDFLERCDNLSKEKKIIFYGGGNYASHLINIFERNNFPKPLEIWDINAENIRSLNGIPVIYPPFERLKEDYSNAVIIVAIRDTQIAFDIERRIKETSPYANVMNGSELDGMIGL